MAVYKVPQDVEAEDKLLGPFSFRQFIYLIIAALGAFIGFLLSKLFLGLFVIPLPFVLFFLVLALPLRKDQPMETYLVAVVRFFLKPHRRMWMPDGSIGLVTITAPKVTDVQLTKDLGGTAAAERIGYLAQVLDTQGWSTRGVVSPAISMDDTVYAEAQATPDILDGDTPVARSFDTMISQSNAAHKQNLVQQFQQAAQEQGGRQSSAISRQQAVPEDQTSQVAAPLPTITPDDGTPSVAYNPYPTSMHQHVLSPSDSQQSNQSPVTSNQLEQDKPKATHSAASVATDDRSLITDKAAQDSSPELPSPDIMRLANNNDLSISALAHEAHRIQDKEDGEEVVISLR